MNDTPEHIGPGEGGPDGGDPDDLFAAEFVLGTLPLDERLLAERRIATEAAFAARVREWEGHFDNLNVEYVPVPVPDLLPRIERRLFGTPGHQQGRHFIRMIAILTGAVAAAFALFFLVLGETGGLRPPPTHFAATLEAQGQNLTFAASWSEATGELQVTRTSGPAAGPEHDYELWLIGSDGVPKSLGLLRGHESRAAVPGLAPGVVLAVSYEPSGGSTTGKPTGPVLVKGVVARL